MLLSGTVQITRPNHYPTDFLLKLDRMPAPFLAFQWQQPHIFLANLFEIETFNHPEQYFSLAHKFLEVTDIRIRGFFSQCRALSFLPS
jgi:hypothetical protein